MSCVEEKVLQKFLDAQMLQADELIVFDRILDCSCSIGSLISDLNDFDSWCCYKMFVCTDAGNQDCTRFSPLSS